MYILEQLNEQRFHVTHKILMHHIIYTLAYMGQKVTTLI